LAEETPASTVGEPQFLVFGVGMRVFVGWVGGWRGDPVFAVYEEGLGGLVPRIRGIAASKGIGFPTVVLGVG